MGKTEKKVRLFLKKFNASGHDSKVIDNFEKSTKLFEGMVTEGIAKPRGYTLQTIEDYISPLAFNVSESIS